MRHFLVFLCLVFLTCCQSQIPENIDGYADANFKAVASKSKAKYYRVHKHVESLTTPSINPNANAGAEGLFNEGYGTTFNTPIQSGVSIQEITFYDFNNTKVLAAGALAKAGKYELYNLATWFDKNGNKREIGFFKNNVRGRLYETYDEKGKVINKGYYVNGKKVTNFKIDKRLVGKWQHKYISSGYFGQEYKYILYNRFYKDGAAEIWNEEDVETDLLDIEPDITFVHYNFVKTGDNTGVLKTYDYFSDTVDEEDIEFVGANKFISTITKHADPKLVGAKYEFTLVKE